MDGAGFQELTWESLELHALTPPLPSLLRRKLEPSTVEANSDVLCGKNYPSKAKPPSPVNKNRPDKARRAGV